MSSLVELAVQKALERGVRPKAIAAAISQTKTPREMWEYEVMMGNPHFLGPGGYGTELFEEKLRSFNALLRTNPDTYEPEEK